MNPLKLREQFIKYNGFDCREISCNLHCRYYHDSGKEADFKKRDVCPYEWQCTLNYPGRYD